jgi:polyisoprenyl-teichoic acid--peptidoglycan teichoic acid transferase
MRRPLALVAVLALAATVVAGVVAVGGYRPFRASAGQAITVQRAHAGAAEPSFRRRVTFLVVGSDSGAPKFGRGGTAERGRADSIHLVVLDPVRKQGIVLGFPRDSYVPIAGHGTGKITGAMAFGGPPLLVSTIERLTGINVDYWVVTSFDGLSDMVSRVGGVQVNVDMNVNDHAAGAHLRRGSQLLGGASALAYARARKSVPGGDFTRSRHQAQILLGGLATFQRQTRQDPARVMKWLAIMDDEVKTSLPVGELLRLALLARSVPPSRLNNVVVPGAGGSAGGASIVRLTSAAYPLFARIRSGVYR